MVTPSLQKQKPIGCRTWASIISIPLFIVATLAPLLLPWPVLQIPGLFFVLALLAWSMGPAIVLSATRVFDHGLGVIVCILLLLVPWMCFQYWPLEQWFAFLVIDDRVATFGIITIVAGMIMLPLAFARTLWNYDLTCCMTYLFSVLVFWIPIIILGTLQVATSKYQHILSITNLLGLTLLMYSLLCLLAVAAIMFVVNMGRLFVRELD